MFNDGEDLYGLMYEPKDGFGPKAKGLAFQKAAGGTGDLEKYMLKSDSYGPGDNVAYRVPVTASSSCEHPPWGWSLDGINDGDKFTTGWSNYYELGDAEWVTNPNGQGAPSPNTVEWVAFAFPMEWKVDKVLIYSRTAINPFSRKIQGLPREMYVEVSDDGEKWTKVATYKVKESDVKVYPEGVLDAGENMVLEIPFEPVKTRNVRITFTKLEPDYAHQEGNYFVQLQEVEILMAE